MLDTCHPDAVLVVGDVNSTIACALVAAKKQVPVIHVEAGLRSGDRHMPEEINRVLTDRVSDLLFTTEASAAQNLAREGVAPERVHFVGNVMIDSLRHALEHVEPARQTLAAAGVPDNCAGGFGLVTLHRPSNVEDPAVLKRLVRVLIDISRDTPLVFPIHPRTASRLQEYGLRELLSASTVAVVPPLGYLEMLSLMREARMVLTDSGGIQEETTALGVPCLTLRDNTERPVTVEQGTNTLVGTDPTAILAAYRSVLDAGGRAGRMPELWDGRAARRIVAVINAWAAQ